MNKAFEITGRVIRNITLFNQSIYQIDVTNSKSYYVLATSKPAPMLNCEIQIKVKPVHVFNFNNCKAVLYKEINN
ncbi:MAG: hypothetical protein K8R74_03170 [Bacteroidales bacterium]|nr:hypothetical protein [Bacteroidales bacterium]